METFTPGGGGSNSTLREVLVCGKAHNQAAPAERVVGLFTNTGGHRP
jgi:hypothetical protein